MGRTSDARSRILECAIDLLWLKGYGAVSVDDICEAAGVRKGSFYHFFLSKDDAVMAALEAHWEARRPVLDHFFSVTVEPIERLRGYFDSVYERQKELRGKYGRVPGCFFLSIGVECAQQHPLVARKVQSLLANYERYYESALRDAQREGKVRITADDIPKRARALFSFMEGVLGQARIQDDPEVVKSLGPAAMQFLGFEESGPGPVTHEPREAERAAVARAR